MFAGLSKLLLVFLLGTEHIMGVHLPGAPNYVLQSGVPANLWSSQLGSQLGPPLLTTNKNKKLGRLILEQGGHIPPKL